MTGCAGPILLDPSAVFWDLLPYFIKVDSVFQDPTVGLVFCFCQGSEPLFAVFIPGFFRLRRLFASSSEPYFLRPSEPLRTPRVRFSVQDGPWLLVPGRQRMSIRPSRPPHLRHSPGFVFLPPDIAFFAWTIFVQLAPPTFGRISLLFSLAFFFFFQHLSAGSRPRRV